MKVISTLEAAPGSRRSSACRARRRCSEDDSYQASPVGYICVELNFGGFWGRWKSKEGKTASEAASV